ncbi:uncharacterized protein MONOS_17476 [Monocercomonoides exilis]|uniref:uncharacterized protein n=1 Tax=Monocercomonoides exilis TaxID=2049356 RepID=UPI00355A8F01|nr:hypothetical protein MONOS_17476 [Monocercomonoides exilis]
MCSTYENTSRKVENEDARINLPMNAFLELISQLNDHSNEEQKGIISKINESLAKMNEEVLLEIDGKFIYDKIDKMIEDEKISIENALLLLKCIGYWELMKMCKCPFFENYSLNIRLERLITEEYLKKEDKNEKLLIDLCECYLLNRRDHASMKLLRVFLPCLLNAALNKDVSDENRNEAELALLALNNIGEGKELGKEWFLDEITEIIQYHQEHHNLTCLAYLSAWQFLMVRSYKCIDIRKGIVNNLHFVREAKREIDGLVRCINWKNDENELKNLTETLMLKKWCFVIDYYLRFCDFQCEEISLIITSLVSLCRRAMDNHHNLFNECIYLFETMVERLSESVIHCLKEGAFNVALDGVLQPTLEDLQEASCLRFFSFISGIYQGKRKDRNKREVEEHYWKKIKREINEKLEDDGFEDVIVSFYGTMHEEIFSYSVPMTHIHDYVCYLCI